MSIYSGKSSAQVRSVGQYPGHHTADPQRQVLEGLFEGLVGTQAKRVRHRPVDIPATTQLFMSQTVTTVPGFIGAKLAGAAVGVGILLVRFPLAGRAADDVVLPHRSEPAST